MPGKISIYNLGQLGVDVVKSPVHIDDGAFTSLQNGQVDSVQGVGGIRRRDGMAKLNAVALAGAVRGMSAVPLPDFTQLVRTFYVPIDDAGAAATFNFRKSTNGTTWATTSSGLVYPAQVSILTAIDGGAIHSLPSAPWAALNNRYYYPGNDYTPATTNPTLHMWDGTTDIVLVTIPSNPFSPTVIPRGIVALVPYSAAGLLVSVLDDTNRARILLLDVTTGRLTHLGPQTDMGPTPNGAGVCIRPVVWQGKIFWFGRNLSGGAAMKSFWVRPGDSTWTVDSTSATGNLNTGYCQGATMFLGDLYFGSIADTGAAALLRKRAAAGGYTTAQTSGTTNQGNHYGPFGVSLDGLTMYVWQNTKAVTGGGTNTAGVQLILRSTDGTNFSTELDVGARLNNAHEYAGIPYVDSNGDIYWPVVTSGQLGKILKRTFAGGAWSVVDGNDNHLSDGNPMRGPINAIRF